MAIREIIDFDSDPAVREIREVERIMDQHAARMEAAFREVGQGGSRSADAVERATRKSTQRAGGMWAALGGRMAAAFSVAATARITQRLFQIGASAEETASKFATVFGSQAQTLDAYVQSFASKTGLMLQEGRNYAATFGGLFKAVGADLETAATETERLLALAGDLASFNDTSVQEALEALRSGLVGEAEPLKRFNIVLREGDVQMRAMGMAGKQSAKDLTELERATARTALITELAADQVGDLDRTFDSTSNRTRRLQGLFARLTEAVSVELLPVFGDIVSSLDSISREGDVTASVRDGIKLLVFQARMAWAGLALLPEQLVIATRRAVASIRMLVAGALSGAASLATRASAMVAGIVPGLAPHALRTGARAAGPLNRAAGRLLDPVERMLHEAGEAEHKIALRSAEIYRGLIESLDALPVRDGDTDPTAPPTTPDAGAVEAAKATREAREAWKKIAEAAALAAAYTEEQRAAMQEVLRLEEELAVARKTGSAAAVEAAEARLSRARAHLAVEEDVARKMRGAAEAVARLRPAGAMSPLDLVEEARRRRRQPGGTLGLLGDDGLISERALRRVGMAEEEAKAIAAHLDRAAQRSERWAEAMQSVGASIRSVTRLADAFGGLDDDVRRVAEGVADVIDQVGRLSSLRLDGASGLALLSSYVGIAASVGAAVGGLLMASREEQAEMRRLREALRDTASQFRAALSATFRDPVVGSGVSQAALEQADALIARLLSGGVRTAAEALDLFRQLEELGVEQLGGVRDAFNQIFQGLLSEFSFELMSGQVSMGELVRRAAERLFAGDEFGGIQDVIRRLLGEQGAFGRSVEGAIQALRTFAQLLGLDVPQQLGFFLDYLTGKVLDPERDRALIEQLERLRGLDLTSEEGRAQLRALIQAISQSVAAGGSPYLGTLSPDDLARLLEQLQGLLGGEEGEEGAYARSVQVARSITEIQADELVALGEEQVYLLRQIAAALAPASPLAAVEAAALAVATSPLPAPVAVGSRSLLEASARHIAIDLSGARFDRPLDEGDARRIGEMVAGEILARSRNPFKPLGR